MSATEQLSGNTDYVVRACIDAAVAQDGAKAGVWRIASMLGVTERWVRSYRYGEPARVAAETYLRALDARRLLRAERRAALLQELHDIEAEANGDILDRAIPQAGMGEQRVLGRSGVVRGSRAPVADAGAVTP